MTDSSTLEPDDLRIVRALQIDPRVPFATVASVLGLSEPTVSRRFGRLQRTGAVRVTGVVDSGALGLEQYTVRLRCRPGSAGAIAEALAHRDDVSWVALTAAGTEVTCALRSRTAEARDDLLGHQLPRAAAVLDVEASVLLRKFLGGRGRYWAALAGVLTPEEETAFGGEGPAIHTHPVVRRDRAELDAADEQLLAVLAADGRSSFVDLATASGLTPGRASRRLQALLADGVAHLHVEIVPSALGFRALANLWLRVHPAAVTTVGRSLAALPEVGFVAAVAGTCNLHAVVHCRELDDLFVFTSDRVGALDGVESLEVSPIHRQVKQAGTLVDGDRLEPALSPRRSRGTRAARPRAVRPARPVTAPR